MATRPTVTPTWATGGGRRVEPDAGEKADGFVEGERTPAKKANWGIGYLTDWIAWVSAILDDDEELTYQVPKTGRTVMIHGVAFQPNFENAVAWSAILGAKTYLESEADGVACFLSLNRIIPISATITRVRALVHPGAARTGSNRMYLQMTTNAPNFVSPA